MTHRPRVLLSCAVSIDGYIDDTSASRLLLSNDADFDRVDAVRADHDAILVGANTIRRDNPRLLIRSERRRHQREAAGRPPNPIKVTLTRSGDLCPGANFFTTGDGPKLVYTTAATAPKLAATLQPHATVIDAGEPCDLHWMLADLADRGIQRLMVEGGGHLHTQFLTANLADELHLAIAPFFVGNHTAPRFAYDGTYPFTTYHRMRLLDAHPIGDVAFLHYQLT